MDMGVLQGIITTVFFLAFIALVIWVYLPRHQQRHKQNATRILLEESSTLQREKRAEE